jgi:hypothetical protein
MTFWCGENRLGVLSELMMADFLFIFSEAMFVSSLGMFGVHCVIFLESVMDLCLSPSSGVSGGIRIFRQIPGRYFLSQAICNRFIDKSIQQNI